MLRIGEVEKITNIQAKTLRYWEEVGLLSPAFVDKFTGYRGYDQKNVERIFQIVYLKDLGFSLNEIKNLDSNTIREKTTELNNKLKHINKSIRKLSSFEFKEGEIIMKNFINDPDAIGKWSLVGLAQTKDDIKKEKFYQDTEYLFNDLYLMENGKEYWVISWTKGFIYIGNRRNPYTIDGDQMVVEISYNEKTEFYAVYRRIDRIAHSTDEFIIQDNIDIPFETNRDMIGFWQAVCIVNKPEDYTPGMKSEWKLWMEKLSISPDGTVIISFKDNFNTTLKWTKDLILDDHEITASKCLIKNIDGDKYMFMEWKSGDYIFGGKISCYYVLKKLN